MHVSGTKGTGIPSYKYLLFGVNSPKAFFEVGTFGEIQDIHPHLEDSMLPNNRKHPNTRQNSTHPKKKQKTPLKTLNKPSWENTHPPKRSFFFFFKKLKKTANLHSPRFCPPTRSRRRGPSAQQLGAEPREAEQSGAAIYSKKKTTKNNKKKPLFGPFFT